MTALKQISWVVLLIFCISITASAESWPTLGEIVPKCVLIVKAKTVSEGPGDLRTFEVLESWKGKYRPELLRDTTSEGQFTSRQGEHGVRVKKGQEIIFFFTRHNQPATGPMHSHSTAFPITDGKIIYASTNHSLRKEFEVEAFKMEIQRIVGEKSPKKRQARPSADKP